MSGNKSDEILFGFHPILEALAAGKRVFREIIYCGDKISQRLEDILKKAKQRKIPVKKVKPIKLDSITGTNVHQGIAANVSQYQTATISDILNFSKKKNSSPIILLLDNITDTHNLGAIIRTGLCAGVSGIIIPKDRSVSPAPVVSKISAGALEHILFASVTNIVSSIQILKENQFWVTGLDSTADKSVFATDLRGPVAIVIGSEEKGIRPLVKKNCDFLISIPQYGQIDSLNASAAAAIALYEVRRQHIQIT